MATVKELGLGVAVLNIIITFFAWGDVLKKLTSPHEDEEEPLLWRWTICYWLYLFLNTYLLLRLLKTDLMAILVWFPFAIILLMCRLYYFARPQIPDLLINLYMFVSMTVMAFVYRKLKEQKSLEQTPPVPQTFHNLSTETTVQLAKPTNPYEPPLSVAKPALQSEANKTLPSLGWTDQRNNGDNEHRNWNQNPSIGWQPELRLIEEDPSNKFMPSAPELTISDSNKDQQ